MDQKGTKFLMNRIYNSDLNYQKEIHHIWPVTSVELVDLAISRVFPSKVEKPWNYEKKGKAKKQEEIEAKDQNCGVPKGRAQHQYII